MPPFSHLAKYKKNQIFKAIQGIGLDPKDFGFEDNGADVQLKHKWSKSYFIFGGEDGLYVGRYVVGDLPDWPYEVYSWEGLMPRVSGWLRDVKLDLDTPDLWAELQHESELLGDASTETTENTPFAPEEQKEIERRLREAEERMKLTFSLSTDQIRVLNAKIDYLIDAAGRLGRIDWRNAFVGAIVGYILTAGLPPESVGKFLLTVLRGIGHLYGHKLPEGPLGGF